MSYSIGFFAPNKEAAKAQLAEEFDNVVTNQPCHARDRAQALAAANAFIDLLTDNENFDISVTLSGSIGWNGSYYEFNDSTALSASNLSVSAYLVTKTRNA